MFSQTEIEFLKNPGKFGSDYARSLRCRIRGKVRLLQNELALLEKSGFVGVAKDCDAVAEFSCLGKGANRAYSRNQGLFLVRSPGFEPGSSAWEDGKGAIGRRRSLNWARSKPEFAEYMRAKSYNQRYVKCIISYLDRFMVELREPMDVVRMFSGLTSGQRHNLNRAVRNFLNFHELKGVNVDYLKSLRKAIPREVATFDLNVPSEEEIKASYRKLDAAPLKYRCLWNLLLDSGLRLTEAVRLINNFDGGTEVNGFYRCTLGYFRGSKLAFAAYFSPYTLKLIRRNCEKLDDRTASHYYSKFGYTAPKYLRKFAFDTMISEEMSIPESVADFIEGRTPKKVGARHYTKLLRQADSYYSRYAKYIEKIRCIAK